MALWEMLRIGEPLQQRVHWVGHTLRWTRAGPHRDHGPVQQWPEAVSQQFSGHRKLSFLLVVVELHYTLWDFISWPGTEPEPWAV